MTRTHAEPLDGRRLFAAGIDSSFGNAGSLKLYQQGVIITAALGVDESVYVESVNAAGQLSVRKFDDHGTLDLTWGDNGVVALPFDNTAFANQPATPMVLDKRTGDLLLFGTEKISADTTRMDIVRLDVTGAFDTMFGDGGVFHYGYAPPSNDAGVYTAVPLTVMPLPHGQTLIGAALTRVEESSVQTSDGSTYDARTVTSAAAIRLNRVGQRDRLFGRHGVRLLAAASGTDFSADGQISSHSDAYAVATLRPLAAGGYRAVLTRHEAADRDDNTQLDIFGVTTQTLDATGQQITTDDAWTIHTATSNTGQVDAFNAYGVIAADDTDDVIVFGQSESTGNAIFTLQPGQPIGDPAALPTAGVIVTRIEPIGQGYTEYGATGTAFRAPAAAVRLKPDFAIHHRWADRGVATFGPTTLADDALIAPTLTTDSQGRLLAFVGRRIRRYLER